MSTVPPSPPAIPARLRHRRSADALTAGQLAEVRSAIVAAQAIDDDRGYQSWAGVHGLPLPVYCTHNSPLFLPWHRAYLYFFELALQDRVAGVTVPWWDWTAGGSEGLPAAYADEQDADGQPNPLLQSPIQPSGRPPGGPSETNRNPGQPGAPPLPTRAQVDAVLELTDFMDFQSQLEDLHNGVHVWVGGTMGGIASSAYDPIFWAHHVMVDRIWRLWQLRHPGSGPPAALLDRALAPFAMTVRDTLDVEALGYDYAVTTAAVRGTG
ncbi:MAG: tyrosinase family protein [Solirubrobacteraceae bacterium]|nr:tyrosinase family protein [Solirubrobacteraceae bacterium]